MRWKTNFDRAKLRERLKTLLNAPSLRKEMKKTQHLYEKKKGMPVLGPKPIRHKVKGVNRTIKGNFSENPAEFGKATGMGMLDARVGIKILQTIKANPHASIDDICSIVRHVPKGEHLVKGIHWSEENKPLHQIGVSKVMKVLNLLETNGIIEMKVEDISV